MSSQDVRSTIPFFEVVLLEEWETYVARAEPPPSVEGFTQWVKDNEPDTLRIIGEPVFATIAESIIQNHCLQTHDVSSGSAQSGGNR